ncbi:uncharacterized protein DUF1541 [Ureibacillus xyleni]|uniref:Uncharacterized protein DUF1541 n=1 Tax=Ureibacillus xyleni TaxID=614648 RepID=A0A285THW5_9BACL|nr:YdhK family protein [Ureibacillus xyleni]SOC21869.1 uncharacterized protein DUF1541 [Ureibacillus xyleni]
MMNKLMIGIISVTAALTLSACSGDNNEEAKQNETNVSEEQTNDMAGHDMGNMDDTENMEVMDHSNMNHSGSGEVPEGLHEAQNPKFSVGDTAIIQANHMAGMNGVEATIVGAYDTTVYTVSYTPTNGGDPVTNHKWVIHEELEGASDQPLEPGAEAKISAEHMEGMEGATATIDTAEETTVYMVDYTSTTGEKVTNHKWVTESELAAK